ncbi:MAG: hypothetical protein WC680_11165 [Sulfuricurvum sp.]
MKWLAIVSSFSILGAVLIMNADTQHDVGVIIWSIVLGLLISYIILNRDKPTVKRRLKWF